jgi:colanic acid/amylovoran biosynthesis protein
LCRGMKVLTPRDKPSMEWLERRGFADKSMIIPDIVLAMPLLLPEYYEGISGRSRNGLGISAANYSFARRCREKELREYIENLATTGLAFYRHYGGTIRLFVQVSLPGSDDDQRIVNLLARRLLAADVPVKIVGPECGLGGYLNAISKCSVFIGSRMHACIFSMTTATPTIGLAYQPKFRGLFNHFDLDDWVTDIDFNPSWLQERVFHAAERQTALSTSMRGRVTSVAGAILAAMRSVARRAGALPNGEG